jgi:hypothetical protein
MPRQGVADAPVMIGMQMAVNPLEHFHGHPEKVGGLVKVGKVMAMGKSRKPRL